MKSMSHTIIIDGKQLPIIIRKHTKSRRMVIRYQPVQRHVALTLPRYVSIRQGLHFVEEKRAWIEARINEHSGHVPFIDGAVIPLLGKDYTLKHTSGRGLVRIEGNIIHVPGDTAFMHRRMREWVKRLAREEITALAKIHAAQIGKKLKKISLRDTSSRWGSCSHNGNLSFSWRLIFAPPEVLDYVVSHEVAHLREHNHSQAFWDIVEQLHPNSEKPRKWLKTHGQMLYTYGA